MLNQPVYSQNTSQKSENKDAEFQLNILNLLKIDPDLELNEIFYRALDEKDKLGPDCEITDVDSLFKSGLIDNLPE